MAVLEKLLNYLITNRIPNLPKLAVQYFQDWSNDVNKSWQNFLTEDLFSETEKIKIIQTSFPEHKKKDTFNKSKFYTAIQQLYIDNTKFRFNRTTLMRNLKK